jgi:putative addiction module component (TIGR02574 family)
VATPHKLVTEALALSIEEREELVQALLDSLEDGCELPPDELAELDEAIADADEAIDRGEVYSADQVLAEMRAIR